jgi:hypothetical protein
MASPTDLLTSLNWNLRATRHGDSRLLFGHYTDPTQNHQLPNVIFHKFLHLPCELQQHMMSFCDPATLFQLMQVSFAAREEAKKLFWSVPETRFLIDGQWVLAGGHPRHTDNDLEALTHMQHIEVNFASFGSMFVREWADGGDFGYIPEGGHCIFTFWEVLRRRFPRVTSVVLTEVCSLEPSAPVSKDTTRLAAASPDDVVLSTSEMRWLSENWDPCSTRYLWQLKCYDDKSPDWELVETS